MRVHVVYLEGFVLLWDFTEVVLQSLQKPPRPLQSFSIITLALFVDLCTQIT